METLCFILTGKINQDLIVPLIQAYQEAPYKILSTWADEDPHVLSVFRHMGFEVVVNELPTCKTSANYQSVCIASGCRRAKELGHGRCVRMRTDMIPVGLAHLANILVACSSQKLLCLSGMCSEVPKLWYYLDVLIAGPTETLLRYFTPQQREDDARCAEIFWLEEYIGQPASTKENVTSVFSFCGHNLLGQPVVCHWIGKGWELLQCYIRPTNNFIWYE